MGAKSTKKTPPVRGGRYRLAMLLALAAEVAITGLIAVVYILTDDLGKIWERLFAFFLVTVLYTVYAFLAARPLLQTAQAPKTGRILLIRVLSGAGLVAAVTGFVVAMIAIWTSGYPQHREEHREVEEGAWSTAVVAIGFALGLMCARLLSPRLMMRIAVPVTLAFLALAVVLSVIRIHNDVDAIDRPLTAAWVLAATGFIASLILSRAERGGWLERVPEA